MATRLFINDPFCDISPKRSVQFKTKYRERVVFSRPNQFMFCSQTDIDNCDGLTLYWIE